VQGTIKVYNAQSRSGIIRDDAANEHSFDFDSFRESGVREFRLGQRVKFAQWSGLFVPAGTPDDVMDKLRAAARKVANDAQVQQVIRSAGSPIEYLDAPEFQSYWDRDAAVMADVVQRIGKVE